MGNSRIEILFVLGGLGCGGAERIAVDILEHIDQNLFHIDFLVPQGSDRFYDERVKSQGSDIFYSPRFNLYNRCAYRKWFKEYLSLHHYDVIHFHQVVMVTSVADLIHEQGIKIIVHAHSTSFRGNQIVKKVKKFLISKIPLVADYMVACSEDAGKSYFGQNCDLSPKYEVLWNAIDTEKFVFDLSARTNVRNRYGISDKSYVLGHVGSFTQPKNHKFLLSIFSELYRRNDKYRLMLVGTGRLFKDIQKLAKTLNCSDGIVFTGPQQEVAPFYSAMDLFVFPSIHEGLPLSVVEAQANGLPCILSNAVSKDTAVCNGSVRFIGISSVEEWCKSVESDEMSRKQGNFDIVKSSKYDINLYVKRLERIYINVWSEHSGCIGGGSEAEKLLKHKDSRPSQI